MTYPPMQLAHAYIRTGELADALAALNDQLAQHPDDAEARRLRAAVLLRVPGSDHLAKALADLEHLPAKTAADYMQLSVLAERLGDYPRATAAMRQAVTADPQDARLLERLLGLHMQQGDWPGALAIVRAQAADWRWRQWEGDIRLRMQEFAAAAAAYEQALALLAARTPEANPLLRAMHTRMVLAQAYALRRCGQYAAAEQGYRAAQQAQPDDPTIAFNLGTLRALRGDLAGGVAACRAALAATHNPQLVFEMRQTLQTDPDLQALAALVE